MMQPTDTPTNYPNLSNNSEGDTQPSQSTVEPTQDTLKNPFTSSSFERKSFLDKLKSYDPPVNHKYPKAFFITFIVIISILGLLSFIQLTWLAKSYPWIIFPSYLGIITLAIFFVLGSPRYENSRVYTTHTVFWFITSTFFLIWNLLVTHPLYPWSMWPIGVFFVAFAIHSLFVHFRKYFGSIAIHLVIFVVLNVNLYLTWCFGSTPVPWFLFVLIIW